MVQKRARNDDEGPEQRKRQRLVLENLPEDLWLQILTCLASANDLVTVARCSSKLNRLANDPQLWKRLLIYHHSASHSQALDDARVEPDHTQWKALFRLQTNWLQGSPSSQTSFIRRSFLPPPPIDFDTPSPMSEERQSDTIVVYSGQYFFTTSRSAQHADLNPVVTVNRINPDNSHHIIGTVSSPALTRFYSDRPHLDPPTITEMSLDAAQKHKNGSLRMAVFYSSGQWVLFRIKLDAASVTAHEEHLHLFTRYDRRTDPIIAARYHCPVLITCTRSYILQVHTLTLDKSKTYLSVCASQPAVQSSFCWKPLVLNLARAGKYRFKASITYATPFFPGSWTVACQEFQINLPKDEPGRSADISTQSATCIPPATLRQSMINSLHRSGNLIVASRSDNTIDLYEVSPATSQSSLGLHHRRVLFGHTTAVTSVSLDGLKCVSAGRDGRLKVWDLDQRRATAPRNTKVSPVDVAEPQIEEAVDMWAERDAAQIEHLSFDRDKIVLVEDGRSPDRVRVLSFA